MQVWSIIRENASSGVFCFLRGKSLLEIGFLPFPLEKSNIVSNNKKFGFDRYKFVLGLFLRVRKQETAIEFGFTVYHITGHTISWS